MSTPIKKQQLQIRVSAEEKAALRALAERAGTDLSTFVLTRALPRLEREFHMLLHAIAEPARRAIALRELNDLLTDIAASDLGAVCADPWGLERLDERMQNYVAAMVEEAAGHLGVMPPRWTAEVAPLRVPWFNSESKVLRPYLLMASPVPYRRRNIFVESVLGTRAGSGARARARVPGFRGGEGTVRYASEGVVWRTAPRVIREGGRPWGDDSETLSRERIESLLRALSDELGARGTTGEVHVVGGAVMCLVYGAREATKDVDALMRPSTALREAAAAVGAREGVAEDWLNDAVRGFLSVRGAFEPWLELPNLRVMVAQPRYLLAMKCLAFRPEGEAPDRADVRFLVRLLDVRSAAEALAIVSEYYDEPMLTLRTRLSLEEFFGMEG